MSTEYRVWTICDGALEDEEEFASSILRDQRAEELSRGLRASDCADWQVMTADVTYGCSVGECAGEEAEEWDSSARAEEARR